jgi:hypothetical protein
MLTPLLLVPGLLLFLTEQLRLVWSSCFLLLRSFKRESIFSFLTNMMSSSMLWDCQVHGKHSSPFPLFTSSAAENAKCAPITLTPLCLWCCLWCCLCYCCCCWWRCGSLWCTRGCSRCGSLWCTRGCSSWEFLLLVVPVDVVGFPLATRKMECL